jgi:uncharacterized C2H2 Zn-finger protein
MSGIVELRCPQCRRWLAETDGYGRAICPTDGWEITVRSKEARKRLDNTPAGGRTLEPTNT